MEHRSLTSRYIDGLLYAKFGKKEYSVVFLRGDHSYEAYMNNQVKDDKIDFKKETNDTPYGFMAIDPSAGKILWRIETNEDPSLAQGNFGLRSHSRIRFLSTLLSWALAVTRTGIGDLLRSRSIFRGAITPRQRNSISAIWKKFTR